MRSRFYILDGLSLIYRAILTKGPPLSVTHADGVKEITKGTYYFTRMLFKLLREKKPEYLALAMDAPRGTLERSSLFPGYKNKRKPRSSEDFVQITRCIQITKALGIPVIEFPRMEADDIIATLARICAGEECLVVICSRDKDMHQLLRPNVIMFDAMKEEYFEEKDAEVVWGVPTHKIPMMQAIMGDPGDQVPGIPGIGKVTARDLCLRYDSWQDMVIAATMGDFTDALAEKICTASADGTYEKMLELVTLRDDLEIIADPDDLAFDKPDVKKAGILFRHLGFRRWE